MEDYRHRPRKNTPHVVKAFDAEHGGYVGRVVDITADGLMLVTKAPFTQGLVLNLRIILPVMAHNKTDVVVEARVVWSGTDSNPAFYRTGIQFVNLSGEDGYLLEDVMHKLNLVG